MLDPRLQLTERKAILLFWSLVCVRQVSRSVNVWVASFYPHTGEHIFVSWVKALQRVKFVAKWWFLASHPLCKEQVILTCPARSLESKNAALLHPSFPISLWVAILTYNEMLSHLSPPIKVSVNRSLWRQAFDLVCYFQQNQWQPRSLPARHIIFPENCFALMGNSRSFGPRLC